MAVTLSIDTKDARITLDIFCLALRAILTGEICYCFVMLRIVTIQMINAVSVISERILQLLQKAVLRYELTDSSHIHKGGVPYEVSYYYEPPFRNRSQHYC